MTQTAIGPNGEELLAIYSTQSAAEAAQVRVFRNGQHEEADRSDLRQAIIDGEMTVNEVPRDAKNITQRWDDPFELPDGRWAIVIPADEARLTERDDTTGDVLGTAPEWQGIDPVEPAMEGDIVEHGGKTWRSLLDWNVWEPGVSGWREVVEDGHPEWLQPTGAHDAYQIGETVMFGGEAWTNTIEANVWEPGVTGWEKVNGGGDEPQPWVQPTGAHDAYPLGVVVTHAGQTWVSDVDANVWEPGVFGWSVQP